MLALLESFEPTLMTLCFLTHVHIQVGGQEPVHSKVQTPCLA